MHRSRLFKSCAALMAGALLAATTLSHAPALAAPQAMPPAAPLAASTATPRPTRTPRPPRPTRTPRVAATATSAAGAGASSAKLNPEAAFALAQNDPCGLLPGAETERLAATVKARDSRTWCEYDGGPLGFIAVEIDRDDGGLVLARELARFAVNNGCGRDKAPTDADIKPFTGTPLVDKLKQLAEQANKCGAKFVPVSGLGSLAYTDNGNLLIVLDKYLMNVYVQDPKGDEKARRLAVLAFAR